MKTIILIVAAVLVTLALCTPAKAQFRPCVWPQTCG